MNIILKYSNYVSGISLAAVAFSLHSNRGETSREGEFFEVQLCKSKLNPSLSLRWQGVNSRIT